MSSAGSLRTVITCTPSRRGRIRPFRQWPSMVAELTPEKRRHPIEGVEAKRGRHRWTQIRVGVDVVEHAPAIRRLEVLDAADVEPRRVHDAPRCLDGLRRNVWIWVELDG